MGEEEEEEEEEEEGRGDADAYGWSFPERSSTDGAAGSSARTSASTPPSVSGP